MGGGGGGNLADNTIAANRLYQSTPHVFEASREFMPSEYFGNRPIYDPTPILNAYMQRMPQFLQASRSMVEPLE